MKFLSIILTFLFISKAMAMTRGNFTGLQMLLNISSNNYDGSVDGSPHRLFLDLNVPEQNTFLGPGKALATKSENLLSFVCGKRGENNYQCSIIIHKSNLSYFQPGKAFIEFRGETAQFLFKQFYSNGQEYSFRDEAGLIWIFSTPERFFIKFDAQGV